MRAQSSRTFLSPAPSSRSSSRAGSACGFAASRLTQCRHLPSERGRLFVTRARAVDPSFAASEAVQSSASVRELPLALELAAARTALFSPEQMLERLSQRLDLLKGERDADPRQQTLRATIECGPRLRRVDDPQETFLITRTSERPGLSPTRCVKTVRLLVGHSRAMTAAERRKERSRNGRGSTT